MGLPVLQTLMPQTVRAAGSTDVRRLLSMCAPLGFHTPNLFPESAGRNYEVTPYLQPLQPVREKFTVISGLMHPMVDGGHSAEKSFLTGAAHPGQPSFRNSISVDQFAAERIGHQTRFPFLALSASHNGISYTRSGVQIPAETKPSRLFKRLFLEGTEQEKAEQMRRIKDGQSIMDLVRDQTKALGRRIGREDHGTLEQYYDSVRDVEKRLVQAEYWAKQPKPTVEARPPTDIEDRANFVGRMQLMYDLIFLALQTDSTRLITFKGAGGNEVVDLKGIEDGWHNLSHHGKDPDKIKQLTLIEAEEMKLFGKFLQRLNESREGEHTLLDQTAIFFGSNLGNASSHNNINLPVIASGGHFKHGQHLTFEKEKPPPLCNLLVSCLQHLRLNVDEFSTGHSTLTGLEAWS